MAIAALVQLVRTDLTEQAEELASERAERIPAGRNVRNLDPAERRQALLYVEGEILPDVRQHDCGGEWIEPQAALDTHKELPRRHTRQACKAAELRAADRIRMPSPTPVEVTEADGVEGHRELAARSRKQLTGIVENRRARCRKAHRAKRLRPRNVREAPSLYHLQRPQPKTEQAEHRRGDDAQDSHPEVEAGAAEEPALRASGLRGKLRTARARSARSARHGNEQRPR